MSMQQAMIEDCEALRAATTDDPRWQQLRKIVQRRSLLHGDFQLSSGRQSRYLFQLRQTTLDPEGAALISELVIDFMDQHGVSCVGGLELGAVPIVAAIAVKSHDQDSPVSAFFVRKQPKQHGAKEQIDGHIVDTGYILMIDDVTTTGGSLLRAVDAVSTPNRRVAIALSIVDREEGAAQNCADRGVTLYSLFKRSDFDIGV